MKPWNRDALSNHFKKVSERAERVRHEFDMGNPDLGVCDRLLRIMWSDIGEVLQQRKEHGWPK